MKELGFEYFFRTAAGCQKFVFKKLDIELKTGILKQVLEEEFDRSSEK
jgi:hypothetical protein